MDAQILDKLVHEYFNNINNKEFINFIDIFCYGNKEQDVSTIKLLEKFLKDNDLETAYINECFDNNNPDRYFRKCTLSQIGMLNDVRTCLLSESYRRLVKNETILKSISKKYLKLKNHILNVYYHLNNNEIYMESKIIDSLFIKNLKNDV